MKTVESMMAHNKCLAAERPSSPDKRGRVPSVNSEKRKPAPLVGCNALFASGVVHSPFYLIRR